MVERAGKNAMHKSRASAAATGVGSPESPSEQTPAHALLQRHRSMALALRLLPGPRTSCSPFSMGEKGDIVSTGGWSVVDRFDQAGPRLRRHTLSFLRPTLYQVLVDATDGVPLLQVHRKGSHAPGGSAPP